MLIKRFLNHSILLDQALVSGSNFLTILLLNRLLGLSGFGDFSLIWLTAHLTVLVSEGCLGGVAIYVSPRFSENERLQYLKGLFSWALLYSTTAFILVYILSYTVLSQGKLSHLAFPAALFAFSFSLQWFARRCFHCLSKGLLLLSSDSIAFFLRFLIFFSLLFSTEKVQVKDILIICSALNLIACLPLLFTLGFPSKLSHKQKTEHLKSTKWLLPLACLQWLTGYSYFFIADFYFGSAVVGGLRNIQNIFSIPGVWSQSLSSSLPHKIGKKMKEGQEACKAFVLQMQKKILLISTVFSIFILVTGEFIIQKLYGAESSKFYGLIYWMIALMLIQFTFLPKIVALKLSGQSHNTFKAELISFTVMAVCIIPLSSLYNVHGLMAAVILGNTCNSAYSASRKLKLS